MLENAKRAIVGLIGGMGLILLLVGAVTHVYSTVLGVILMFACWLVLHLEYCGALEGKRES